MVPLNLETITTMKELGLLETEIKNPRRNTITHLEKEALTSLTNNDMIIIKPADKGGAIVVMNRKDYIAEGYDNSMMRSSTENWKRTQPWEITQR